MQPITKQPAFDLTLFQSFWKAMVAKGLVDTKIPDLLAHKGKTLAELGNEMQMRQEKLETFLLSAIACGFIAQSHQNGQRFFTLLDHTLVSGQPQNILIKHILNPITMRAWGGLADNLRVEEPAVTTALGGKTLWQYLDENPEANKNFNESMTILSAPINPLISKAYKNWSGTIIDVGGGEGSLLSMILKDHPGTRGIIFDREEGLAQTREMLEQEGLTDRIVCVAGSYMETLPEGDIYLFKNVLHNRNDAEVMTIFKNVRAAAKHARILNAEILLDKTQPSVSAALLSLYMMVENGGKQRSAEEFRDLLTGAGFPLHEVFPVGKSPYSLIEAISG